MLAGLDLAVHEHQAVALIGASGSGKSTLLRCIDLLDEIDDGDVLIDGEVITDPAVDPVAARRRLAMVFQGYNLFPHLTVLENVALGPVRAHGVARDEAEARAAELLTRFGLAGRERDHPDRLSGGQQQRVAIVRALATRPRALLLDEVTSALDPELVGEVLAVIRELKDEGMTMLLTTHEMAFAREVADEVCFLHEAASWSAVRRASCSPGPSSPRRSASSRVRRRRLTHAPPPARRRPTKQQRRPGERAPLHDGESFGGWGEVPPGSWGKLVRRRAASSRRRRSGWSAGAS